MPASPASNTPPAVTREPYTCSTLRTSVQQRTTDAWAPRPGGGSARSRTRTRTPKTPSGLAACVPRSRAKSQRTAYLLWALGLGGLLGLHRFYLGDARQGLVELATLGGLGALAARDLLAMERLVDRANGVHRVPAPSAWARPGLKGRWLPIMWRGRLVAAAVALSLVLTVLAGLGLALSVLLTWALGWWTFTVGVFLGGQLLPLAAPILDRWHYRLSGRAPGEPLAEIETYPREAVRVDPVPDEAFLPLAAAIAVAFQLVELGPAIPLVGTAYQLGLPVVPFIAGLVLPPIRAPVAMGLRSVRYDDRGRVSSQRPIGQRMALYFGLTFVVGALVQAYLARDAGVFTLVFSLAVPVLMATAWYNDDRLARDVRRLEVAMRERIAKAERAEGR